jgi:hypothetical protein
LRLSLGSARTRPSLRGFSSSARPATDASSAERGSSSAALASAQHGSSSAARPATDASSGRQPMSCLPTATMAP